MRLFWLWVFDCCAKEFQEHVIDSSVEIVGQIFASRNPASSSHPCGVVNNESVTS